MRTPRSALLAALAGAALTMVLITPASGQPPTVPGEVILKFRAGTSQSVKDAILSDLDASTIRRFTRIKAEHDRVTGVSVEEAIRRYKNHPNVEIIEPNYILSVSRTPNDPLFDQLWGLRNTGQTGGTSGADIEAAHAWDVQTGSTSVVVGVIDTGVDIAHPDLAGNIWTNPGEVAGNGVDDEGNGFVDDVHGWDFVNDDNNPFDDYGHGTHVAGTIGAAGDNGVGVTGVAWTVRIMPLKFIASNGLGSTADAISCVEYATLMGADLTNNSWGGGGYSEALRLAIQDAGAAGILFVAAAGNAATNTDFSPHYPSGYDLPNIISVAATDDDDLLAVFSNYGVSTVDLGAPGVNVLSTVPGNGYAPNSGTSMATPHVSGILALMKSEYPLMTMAALRTRLLGTVDPVPSLTGKVATGGRANAWRALERPDSTAPDSVADLRLAETWSGGLRVEWTASGDDGSSGRASAYDLRYAAFPLTPDNFATGTPAPASDPSPAGSAESADITGLGFSATYYVALRVLDEMGNASGISNVVSGTTLGQPQLAYTPATVQASLLTGGTALHTLTLSNAGQGTLDFTVQEVQGPSSVTVHEFTPVARGEADPRVGDPVTLGSGGPDRFGYRWVDSDQTGGPVFDWVEISGVGTRIPMTSLDANFGPIPIGFDFPFYGASFSSVRVCTHGWISFTNGSTQYTNQPLPNPGAPENQLAVFWEDLNFGGVERAYYHYDGTRFIIEYLNVPRTAGGGALTFQVLLYPNGEIVYQYLSMSGMTEGATVGFQNGARDDGLTIAFNTPYVHDGLAIRIGALPDWFSVTPVSGRVNAAESLPLQIAVDAADLPGGTYPGSIVVRTNDPDQPEAAVPIQLVVTGVADIDLSRTAIDFGPTFVGASRTDSLVVSNRGTDALSVTSVAASPGEFSVSPASFSLAPRERRRVYVTFQPLAAVPAGGSVVIQSNDPDEPERSITLSGAGIVPPDVAVSPESLSVELFTGESAIRPAEIRNEGGSDLIFEIDYRLRSAPGMDPVATPPSAPAGDLLASYGRHASGGGAEPFTAASPSPRPGVLPLAERIQQALADSIPVFHDGMEHGVGGWTHGAVVGTVDLWSQSTARSSSGTTSWRVRQHDFQGSDALRSPPIDLRFYRDALLALRQWYDYDDCDGDPSFEPDGHIVEVTTDGGATWQTLTPLGGYPYVLDDICSNPLANKAAYSHTGGVGSSFIPAVFDLTAHAGQIVQLRFRAGWDCGNCGPNEGWYLDDVAVYSTSPRTVTADPESGVVPAGGALGLTLNFSAASLNGGDYRTDVLVTSNDPDENPAAIATSLHVTGAPDIAWDPPALDFGIRFIGSATTDTVAVFNAGTDVLHVTEVALNRPELETDTTPFELAPGARRDLLVTFRPTAVGPVVATLALRSDDRDEPEVSVPVQGTGVVAPDVELDPASLSASVQTGQTATRALTVRNTGGADLVFRARAALAAPSPPPDSAVAVPDSLRGATANVTSPSPPPPSVQAVYSGTHLRFGVTALGEVMPYQYPIGTEHLQAGSYVSGYAIAYVMDGADRIAFALVSNQLGVVPESYTEIENSPSRVVVEVTTRTGDGALRIRRRVTFERDARAILVETRLENVTANPLGSVVFKEGADWDVDSTFPNDWNYDREGNLVYATAGHAVAIGSREEPDLMDINGWNDITVRPTVVDFPVGPVLSFDGLALLHFDLGPLGPSDAHTVTAAYGAGDNLDQLRDAMAAALRGVGWLTVAPEAGTLAPGQTVDLTVGFDPGRRPSGDYDGTIAVESNDPDEAMREIPVTMTVMGVPVFTVHPTALDFGSVFVGSSASQSIRVRNDGVDPLIVSGITSGDPSYSASPASFTLEPRDSQAVAVLLQPTSAGDKASSLVITHNAPGSTATIGLSGVALVPPDVETEPATILAETETGRVQTRTLTVHNRGGSDLNFTASGGGVSGGAPTAAPASLEDLRSTPNLTSPSTTPPSVQAIYSGIHVRFGVTPYGEVIPYQYPIGVEHLQTGLYLSGYTLAYVAGGERLAYSVNAERLNVTAESYSELENTAARVVVLVTVRTSDGVLRVRRRIELDKTRRAVRVESSVENLSTAPVTNVVFKEDVDWDADGDVFNTWDYDVSNSMVYAREAHYVAIGSDSAPSMMDIDGWGDYSTRATSVFTPGGPIVLDGLAILHFELGSLGVSQARTIVTAYASGDDLAQLRDEMAQAVGSASWLSVSPSSGSVPAGQSMDLSVRFDPERMPSGEYRGEVRIASNDPDEPLARVPATMVHTARPVLALSPAALDFGGVYLGGSKDLFFWARNDGVEPLVVSSIVAPDASYSAVPTTLNVAPLDSQLVAVTFAPTTAGDHAASLLLTHNAAGSPTPVSVSGTGVVPPSIAFRPDRVEAAVMPGRSGSTTVHVHNDGGSDLTFSIATPSPFPEALVPGGYRDVGKGETDSREGILGLGGPDLFGHYWVDSDHPGGPAFEWTDIRAIGTHVPFPSITDDATLGPYPIGFDFPYFGSAFQQFRVCSNGWISFTSSSNSFANQPLPNAGPGVPENVIAALWDDLILDVGAGSSVDYHADSDRLIVQYTGVRPLGVFSPTPHTFQIILHRTGEIVFKYLSVGSLISGATVGFQNGARNDGLTLAFNNKYLHPNLAVRIARVTPWLSVAPLSGLIHAGESLPLTLELDAVELQDGDHAANLHVSSNDPAHPSTVVPVLLHVGVTPAAAADFDPNSLNRDGHGRYAVMRVELPAGLDPARVVLESVRFQETVAVAQESLMVGDWNANGIPDLQFRFSRAEVEEVLSEGDRVPVTMVGAVANQTWFVAHDSIRVIRPRLTAPNGREMLISRSSFTVSWRDPDGWRPDRAALYYSTDHDSSWTLIADNVPGSSYAWTVPVLMAPSVRLRVYLFDRDGVMGYDASDEPFSIVPSPTSVTLEESAPPASYALRQNTPNPFNPSTDIRFDLPVASSARLDIFQANGRLVRTLVAGALPAGRYRVPWDGRDDRGAVLPSGVYLYRLSAAGYVEARRMLLLK